MCFRENQQQLNQQNLQKYDTSVHRDGKRNRMSSPFKEKQQQKISEGQCHMKLGKLANFIYPGVHYE